MRYNENGSYVWFSARGIKGSFENKDDLYSANHDIPKGFILLFFNLILAICLLLILDNFLGYTIFSVFFCVLFSFTAFKLDYFHEKDDYSLLDLTFMIVFNFVLAPIFIIIGFYELIRVLNRRIFSKLEYVSLFKSKNKKKV